MSRLVLRYVYMTPVVEFALETLKSLSPVGSAGDRHPGLYRDSHMIFIDGHVVKDASGWQPGQQVNISNPEPYSRKIEAGRMHMNVPGHVYEQAEPIISARFGGSVNVKFVYMPVRFGDSAAFATFSQRQRVRRKLSQKARGDWQSHQPSLLITAR